MALKISEEKSTNADEDGSLSNRHRRYWDLGFLFFSRKIKSTWQLEIMDKDLVMNTEFRIKWPRGLL